MAQNRTGIESQKTRITLTLEGHVGFDFLGFQCGSTQWAKPTQDETPWHPAWIQDLHHTQPRGHQAAHGGPGKQWYKRTEPPRKRR